MEEEGGRVGIDKSLRERTEERKKMWNKVFNLLFDGTKHETNGEPNKHVEGQKI